ncbi:hypothetical protein [Niveibacterium sp.]|uniref:hypothetical protein n=1 Tax=Niveibacterium sp. TaxID=2017444 RepID=UPI0035B3D9B7
MKVFSYLFFFALLALGVWSVRRCLRAIQVSRMDALSREAQFLLAASADLGNVNKASSPSAVQPSMSGKPSPMETELLAREERLVYLLLRVALPEFEVLTHVSSAKLLPRGEHLGLAVLDFVVCRKDFRPVAVVVLDRAGEPARPSRSRALAELAGTGVKLAHWRVEQLPSRTAVRNWVLDDAVPGERRFAA